MTTDSELARRAARLDRRLVLAHARLGAARTWRLSSGLSFVAALIVCAAVPRLRLELWAVAGFLATFPAFVSASRKRAELVEKLQGLRAWYERQLARRRGFAPALPPDGADQGPSGPPSPLAVDLALDGARSLRALLDETWTDGGRAILRARLVAPPPASADAGRARQKHVADLALHRWPLIRLGLLCPREDARVSTHELGRFAGAPLLPPGAGAWVAACIAAWLGALGVVALALTHQIASGWGALAWTGYVVFTLIVLGKWDNVFLRAHGFANHLGTLAPLLKRLEELAPERRSFRALLPRLLEAQPSRRLQSLERALALASVSSNPILSFAVNALLPWSALADLRLEAVRRGLAERLPAALAELHEFEAWSSLALYASAHGGAWPTFVDGARLEFVDLAHPLLSRAAAIGNDLCLGQGERLALLTGSNMSGKSTFLRAVGLNQILANLGAPVRAARYACGPLALESCIQISDSLAEGVSYFYAEVLRLKEILQASASGQPTLALIDEIFRGTNNRERRAGSEAVIRALADRSTTLAVVSTHDLELAALEGPCPGLVNWHFRDDVRSGRLTFDYRLKSGPCPTTNALRLMQLEGLPVTVPSA